MSNNVVGVITFGVNPELGQNLNFAVPSNEVAAMLISARQPTKPLDSVGSNTAEGLSEGKLWTSVTSGHDYNLRQDGNYLYLDLIDIPPEMKSGGGIKTGRIEETLRWNVERR